MGFGYCCKIAAVLLFSSIVFTSFGCGSGYGTDAGGGNLAAAGGTTMKFFAEPRFGGGGLSGSIPRDNSVSAFTVSQITNTGLLDTSFTCNPPITASGIWKCTSKNPLADGAYLITTNSTSSSPPQAHILIFTSAYPTAGSATNPIKFITSDTAMTNYLLGSISGDAFASLVDNSKSTDPFFDVYSAFSLFDSTDISAFLTSNSKLFTFSSPACSSTELFPSKPWSPHGSLSASSKIVQQLDSGHPDELTTAVGLNGANNSCTLGTILDTPISKLSYQVYGGAYNESSLASSIALCQDYSHPDFGVVATTVLDAATQTNLGWYALRKSDLPAFVLGEFLESGTAPSIQFQKTDGITFSPDNIARNMILSDQPQQTYLAAVNPNKDIWLFSKCNNGPDLQLGYTPASTTVSLTLSKNAPILSSGKRGHLQMLVVKITDERLSDLKTACLDNLTNLAQVPSHFFSPVWPLLVQGSDDGRKQLAEWIGSSRCLCGSLWSYPYQQDSIVDGRDDFNFIVPAIVPGAQVSFTTSKSGFSGTTPSANSSGVVGYGSTQFQAGDVVTFTTGAIPLGSCTIPACAANQPIIFADGVCQACPLGQFQQDNVCIPCTPGPQDPAAYLPANSNQCQLCQTGYYEENNVCTLCPAASYLPTGTSVCIPCAPAQIQKNNQCVNCGSGKYEEDNVCKRCLGATYLPAGSNSCQPCPSEQFQAENVCQYCTGPNYLPKGSNTCQACGPAQIQKNHQCQQCPENHYQSNNVCVHCPAAHTLPANSNECQPCQLGYYSNNNVCTECQGTTYLPSGSNTCIACGGANIVIANTCTLCPPRSVASGRSTCTPCGYGQIETNNACTTCPAGQIATSLNTCAAGQTNDGCGKNSDCAPDFTCPATTNQSGTCAACPSAQHHLSFTPNKCTTGLTGSPCDIQEDCGGALKCLNSICTNGN